MLKDLTECLKKGFELGVKWTDERGVMRDPYETNRPENFAPACWSVIGSGLYRLTDEPRYLEWTERWVRRTAEILEENKNSSGFREYVLGYGAMLFPILSGRMEEDRLNAWKNAFASSYTKDATLSDCHVSAAQLLCDLYCNSGREKEAQKRAEEIVELFNKRLTSEGFLKDDDVNGNSIPHAYLTGSFLAATLLNDQPGGVERQVRDLLQKMCSWFKKANGDFVLPFLANRSIYQMYVYPMAAQMAFVGEGGTAKERIKTLLTFYQSFSREAGGLSHTPNHLSPYAQAGLEYTYNRLNTDVGAGVVAWTLLALLVQQGWKGFDAVRSVSAQNVYDRDAGYVVLHGRGSRLAFTLDEHRWGYHLPLQPVSLSIGDELIGPVVVAKREGVKHPYRHQLKDESKMDPLLEPYFGIGLKRADGTYKMMKGKGEVVSRGEFKLSGAGLDLIMTTEFGDGSVRLSYRLSELKEGDQVFFSIPVLLWDGKDELAYSTAEGTLSLRWKDASYRVSATENEGPWDLHLGRYWHAGYGLTANMSIRLKTSPSGLMTAVTVEKGAS